MRGDDQLDSGLALAPISHSRNNIPTCSERCCASARVTFTVVLNFLMSLMDLAWAKMIGHA